jgi:type III secretory pathway component EscV
MQQWWPFPKRITKLPLFLSVEKQQQHTIRSSAISQRRDNYRQQHTEHTHSPQPTLVGWSGEKKQEKNKHCHAQTTIIKTPANLKPPKKKFERESQKGNVGRESRNTQRLMSCVRV